MYKFFMKMLLLAALCVPWATKAQTLGNYAFTTGVDASRWVDMTTATQILSPSGSDNLASAVLNIGFSFPFRDTSYSQYSVNTDGNLRLGSTVTGTSNYTTPFSSTNANNNNPKINAFGCDGYGLATTHYVKALTQELATGDTLLVVEFCTGTYNNDTRNNLYKWQIHLYSNGNIDIVFPGASGIPATAPAVTHQCGLCANNSDGWVVSSATNTAEHFTSGSTMTNASGTWFDANRYYSFIHPNNITCPAPSGITADVSAHSALLTWSRGGSENAWKVTVDEDEYYTSDTILAITNLEANSPYVVSVCAICGSGDTSYAAYYSFRTAVTTDSLPWTYGFEDATGSGSSYTFSPCLGSYRLNTTTAYPYPSSTQASSGTYSAYFYSTSTIQSWLTLPLFEADLNNLFLSFKVLRTSNTYGHWIVGVMSDPADITTFDTLATGQASNNNVWETVEVYLANYNGNGRYLAILAPTGSTNYIYVDDITVSFPPACPTPSDIVATNATSNTVDLSWSSDASGYIVEYGLQGFTPGTGDSVVSSTNSVTLTGLSMGFSYGVYVSAICGEDTSNATYGTFQTGCGNITDDDLPFSENFEAYGTGSSSPINACWNKALVVTAGSTTTQFPYPYSTAAINGSRGLYFYGVKTSSSEYGCWAAMPEIDDDLDVSSLMVNFMVKRSSSSSTSTATYSCTILVGVADSLNGLNSAAALSSNVAWIDTLDFSSEPASSVHSAEVSFENYMGEGKYIVFYAPSPAQTTSSNYNAVYVDDIILRHIPSCFWPSEVVAAQVGSDEAVIAWTPDERTGNPNGWNIEYGPQGFTPGDGEQLTVNDTVVTLTDLVPQTAYDVYVSADCGGEVSEAVLVSFMTSDVAAEMPYFTSFEDGQDSAWVLLNANQTNQWIINNLDEQNGNALFISNNGTTNNYSNSASSVFAMRTFEIAESGDLAIRFDWRAHGESSYDYIRAFIVPTSVNIAPGETNGITATATPQDWINIGSFNNAVKLNLSDTWNSNVTILHFDEENTGFYKLVFFWRNDGSGGSQPPAAIDNIEVRMLTCSQPADLVLVNAEADQIDIAWTPTGDESQWQVRNGDGAWEDVYDTAYSATNLTSYTEYSFYVRAVCGDGDTSFVTGPLTVMTPRDCGPGSFNIVDTIGDGTSASSSYAFYSSTSYRTGFTSSIFTVQELNGMGLQVNNRINGIKLHSGSTGGTIRNAKVYLMETQLAGFSSTPANDTVFRDTMTLVYSGDLVVPANSWVNIPFTTPFSYSGNNNLLITMARDTTPTTSVTFYYTNTTPDYISCYGYRGSATAAQNYVYRTYYRPNVVFDICSEIPSCPRPMEVSVLGISDTSVTIAWENIGSNYQYAIGPDGFDPDQANAVSTTDTFAIINGLSQLTGYDVYVRNVCGNNLVSEWSMPTNFVTPCSAQQLPYTENFESYGSGSAQAISPCWTKGTNSTTAYPYPYSTNPVSGERSLYFYAYHPSTATSTPYYSYAALPMMAAPIDTLQVSFSIRRYSTVTDYYTTRLLVGVMTDPSDISTFVGVDTIDLKDAPALSVHNFEVNLDSYTGDGQFIAFYDAVPPVYNGNSYSYSYVYLDDIVVDYIPSCRRIIDVTFDGSNENSASFHWVDPNANNGGGYEVEYGPEGYTPGNGTSLTTIDTFITITGLATSTGYDFYVRPLCSATDFGPWSFATNFRTVCGIYHVPFFEDFESYGSGASYGIDPCWNKGTSSTTAYPYPYSTNAVNGSRSLYFYGYLPSSATATPVYSYVALPEFNVSVDSLELSFKVRRHATTTDYYTTRLLVGVMSDPTDISTFVGIDTIDLKNEAASSIHDVVVEFGSYTGTGKHIAIYDAVPPLYGTSTYSYSYAYVDDIIVNVASPCGRPFALVGDVTANSITLDWTDTVGASQWQIEYGPSGFELGQGTTVNVSQRPYTITGLTPSTAYDVYVRSFCSPGVLGGTNSGIVTYTTSQVPATLPYLYTFESATEWANWQTASNNAVSWYRGTAEAAEGQYGLYVSADGGQTCNSLHSTITNAVVYRDIDFGATESSFEVSFLAKAAGVNDGNYEGIHVMLVDPAAPVASSSTALTSPWGTISTVHVVRDTNWSHKTVLFDNVSGVKRLVFYWFTSTTSSHPVWEGAGAIDSVAVVEQSCVRPLNTTVTNVGADFVSLQWDGDANANYLVRLREEGTTVNIDNTAATTSITINNLAPSTEYNVWVYHVCDDNTTSYSAPVISFKTTCTLISAVDTLYEDFDAVAGAAYSAAGVLPDCWEGYSNGTNDAYIPHVTDGNSYSYSVTGNAITLTSGSASYGDTKIVRLPKFTEPLNTLTMSYWYCTESNTNGTLYVGYMTGLDYENDFVPLVTHPASSGSQHSGNGPQPAGTGIFDTVSFDSVPAEAMFIAFKWYHNSSFYSVCIDNVEVTSSGNFCVAPQVLPATDISYSDATLNWSSNATDFEVAVKAANEATWPAEVAVSNATSYTVTGLMPEIQYQFRVRAICDTTEGLISDWVEGTFTTAELPCFDPENLVATGTGYTTATLVWDADESQNMWSVKVWNNNFDPEYTATGAATYTVTGLAANTSYYAAVKALCGNGIVESGYSDTIQFTTNACGRVTGVTTSGVTAHSVVVSWNDSGVSKYKLEYGDRNFSEGNGTTVIVDNATSYTITGLDEDHNYSVFVKAVCEEGVEGDWSEQADFSTPEEEVGIDEVSAANQLSIYPNPANDVTTIAVSGVNGEVSITIVDMNGRVVASDSMSCEGDCTKSVEVSGLAQGAYFVRVSGENLSIVRKLIVK